MTDAPRCDCHGVSMYWHKEKTKAGGRWRCREARRERDRKRWASYYYERIPFAVRTRKEMTARRCKALTRRRERQLRREHGSV